MKPMQVEAGRALDWFGAGWAMFMRAPGPWAILALVTLVVLFVASIVPVLNYIALPFLTPLLQAGLTVSARASDSGAMPRVEDLWAPMNDPRTRNGLVALAIGAAVAQLALIALVVVLVGSSILGAAIGGGAVLAGTSLFGGLAVLLVLAAVTMALLYAPILVLEAGLAPVAALQGSFSACLTNMGALAVAGLVLIVASVLASLPLMLGWVLLIPVTIGAIWTSYKAIFPPVPRIPAG
ncbi:MAG: BPSS1780 family membrane protein [Gammaproteobacteria bacterium]